MSEVRPEGLPRRAVLLGAAAVPLAACAKTADAPAAAPQTGQPLAAVSDVPLGSGVVVEGTVVTQPSQGVFKGFKARCTHAGCALTEISEGTLTCRCHGSRFDLNGAVVRGPATEPLVSRPVTVRGAEIVAG